MSKPITTQTIPHKLPDQPTSKKLRSQDLAWIHHQKNPFYHKGKAFCFPFACMPSLSAFSNRHSLSLIQDISLQRSTRLNNVCVLTRSKDAATEEGAKKDLSAKPSKVTIVNVSALAKEAGAYFPETDSSSNEQSTLGESISLKPRDVPVEATTLANSEASTDKSISESLSLTPVPANIAAVAKSVDQTATSKTVKDHLKSTLSTWRASFVLPPKGTDAANTDDFGAITEKLLLSDLSSKQKGNVMLGSRIKNKAILDDMAALGKVLGIDICQTTTPYYARDCFVMHPEGDLLHSQGDPTRGLDKTQKAQFMLKAFDNNAKRGKTDPIDPHSFNLTNNPLFKGYTGGVWMTRLSSQEDHGLAKHSTLHYWEGGNGFYLSNSGNPLIIVGKDLRHVIFQQLFLFDYFNHPKHQKLLQASIKRLYNKVIQMPKEEVMAYYQQLLTLQISHCMGPCDPNKLPEVRGQVLNYLARMDMVNGRIAQTFNLNPENVFPAGEVTPHLDQNMAPGPHNTLLVDEAQLNLQILAAVKKMPLTEKDQLLWSRLFKGTAQVSRDLSTKIAKQKEDLAATKVPVIPFPGNFYDSEGTSNVIFYNFVTGFSETTSRHYVICLGIQLGDNLGTYLEEAMRAYWQALYPDVDVYFIGREDGLTMMNAQNSSNGIHCQTQRLKSRDHSAKEGKSNDKADSKKT